MPSFRYSLLTENDTGSATSSSHPDADDDKSSRKLSIKTPEPPQPDTRIHWYAANKEALLSTGIMHIFNLWTEAGTRDAQPSNGRWVRCRHHPSLRMAADQYSIHPRLDGRRGEYPPGQWLPHNRRGGAAYRDAVESRPVPYFARRDEVYSKPTC